MLPVDPGSEPPTAATVPPSRSVTLYYADGCHLCERALEVVHAAQARTPFTLELVDIGGVAALEAEYREHLPVIEIDGIRAFTYFVSVDALLIRIKPRGGDGSPGRAGSGAGTM
jgi:Glutaredoxin-like domain (DUF836)